ncbi:hypothetical protein T02_4396 [Trichinella nativa]|uniref:Uncharacterized protein n=1 Tax=Trichinella nativa TaxID=6335 RepID=A0A0V1LJG8_9BILA|nr:hypothetical protein T02_4396 [Trichinella nativa]
MDRKMKETRLARNNEILHRTRHFQRIPHSNVEKLPYIKIQPLSIRFNGVSDGLLPCDLKTAVEHVLMGVTGLQENDAMSCAVLPTAVVQIDIR